MTNPLSNRIALITGASRGIGYAAAIELARRGAHIIALARTVGGLEELDDAIKKLGGSATLVPADLRDFPALDRLGGAIHERWGRLDILVLNGAILGPVTPLGHISPEQWAEAIDVNITANWRLIRSLDPLLQKSDAGRVIAVSSGAAHRALAYAGAYNVTKAGFDMMARVYAAECAATKVRVNLVNPGPVATKMRATFMPGEDPSRLPQPEELAPLFAALASPETTTNGETHDFTAWKSARPTPQR